MSNEHLVCDPDICKVASLFLRAKFFSELLKILHRAGLVGEDKNALILFLVAVSRLMKRPINVIVKGSSSSGKNFTVKKILELIPESEVHEITTSSAASWNYQGGSLKHKIVYIQEENDASGSVHPTRLLISEGKLIRSITVRRNGQFVTERQVTEGPVACISTTTKDRLEVDDETRNFSLWTDETKAQTTQIVQSAVAETEPLQPEEIQILRGLQPHFALRAKVQIVMPNGSPLLLPALTWRTSAPEGIFQPFSMRARSYR